MRIFSSAVNCRRVARRISFTTCSAGFLTGPDFCPIFAPFNGYDGPEILPSSTQPICLIGADAGQPREASANVEIKIRLKETLRREVEQAAEANKVSMDAEMIERLARTFAEDTMY